VITRVTLALRRFLAVRKEPFEGRTDSVFAPVALVLVQTIFWRMLAERAQEHGYSNCGGSSGGGEVEVAKALESVILYDSMAEPLFGQ
jgi:hypothetical protein